MQKKQSKFLLPHFCFNHFKCSHLVHQLLKQPVGPRPARRYPDLRLTQVRGHHNSTERLSRVRSDLHTSDHVPHDAEKKDKRSIFVATASYRRRSHICYLNERAMVLDNSVQYRIFDTNVRFWT